MSVTVIGIDPGSERTGWGIVRETSGKLTLVECGIVRTTSSERVFSRRLALIYTSLTGILGRFAPEEAAIEDVFVSQNSKSALKLGQARGVAVAACAAHGIPVSDYEPTLVKKTIVGTGRAEKTQVAFMVGQLLGGLSEDLPLDTTDALGIAICHLSLRNNPLSSLGMKRRTSRAG
ncbi:MAG: crossover junction endodeoxyribonuclease RuvC [Desulfovibrio sp.]|nr:crossover junction endodeoxyribonuclease RuvC [Desulfovibrio sp.]